jgi:signal transduction histidine kinase
MAPGHDVPTSYLPPERSSAPQLAEEIDRVAHSPLVDALLVGSGTALAVLDEARQIVALNATYLDLLGVRDPAEVLGMRPGEAAGCAHAGDAPGGCGTGPACASCGAALAILAGSRGGVGDRECALRIAGPTGIDDRLVRVRAAPFELGGHRFLAFSLLDVTADRRRAAVHRVHLHDLANVASGVLGLAEEIAAPGEVAPKLRGDLATLADRLVSGVKLMRALGDGEELPPVVHASVPARELVQSLATLAAHHPAAAGKRLEVAAPPEELTLFTDPLILEHVLANMAVNAFEATAPEGVVRVEVEERDGEVVFSVWNAGEIPAAVRPRVFQRHFTTKDGEGRGEGTFAMRFFGERCLGGRVTFTSRRGEGTTFEVAVPVRPPAGIIPS